MATPDATVLVVEDEDSFVEALTVGLKREGFRVQVASDGAQALELFDAIRPDLVLMDINLPGINGIEATRQIRAAHPDVQIILLSTYSEADLPADAREVGALAYVHKEDFGPAVMRDLWPEAGA